MPSHCQSDIDKNKTILLQIVEYGYAFYEALSHFFYSPEKNFFLLFPSIIMAGLKGIAQGTCHFLAENKEGDNASDNKVQVTQVHHLNLHHVENKDQTLSEVDKDSLVYLFRPVQSVPLYRVDGVTGEALKIKIVAASLKDVETNPLWKNQPITYDPDIFHHEELQLFCLTDYPDICVLKNENKFVGIKNSEPHPFQFPLLEREENVIAAREIFDDIRDEQDLFRTEYHSKPPHCGDFVKQFDGSSLLYLCIVWGKPEPTLQEIESYLTSYYQVI